jgi:hypothetical protein
MGVSENLEGGTSSCGLFEGILINVYLGRVANPGSIGGNPVELQTWYLPNTMLGVTQQSPLVDSVLGIFYLMEI